MFYHFKLEIGMPSRYGYRGVVGVLDFVASDVEEGGVDLNVFIFLDDISLFAVFSTSLEIEGYLLFGVFDGDVRIQLMLLVS